MSDIDIGAGQFTRFGGRFALGFVFGRRSRTKGAILVCCQGLVGIEEPNLDDRLFLWREFFPYHPYEVIGSWLYWLDLKRPLRADR